MKHAYSDEFSFPPALVLPVEICIPDEDHAVQSCRAKIDTASDMSVVPRGFVERFKPQSFNTFRVRQTGRAELSCLLEIAIDGHRYPVEAIAHDTNYVLIGRDILNRFRLVADGPNEVFEIDHQLG